MKSHSNLLIKSDAPIQWLVCISTVEKGYVLQKWREESLPNTKRDTLNLIFYSDQFVSLEGKEQSLSFHHEMEFHKEMEVCETVDMEGYR